MLGKTPRRMLGCLGGFSTTHLHLTGMILFFGYVSYPASVSTQLRCQLPILNMWLQEAVPNQVAPIPGCNSILSRATKWCQLLDSFQHPPLFKYSTKSCDEVSRIIEAGEEVVFAVDGDGFIIRNKKQLWLQVDLLYFHEPTWGSLQQVAWVDLCLTCT